MSELAQFHFLRPAWLLLVIPSAWVLWSLLRRRDPMTAWRGLIEPHLLKPLLTRPDAQSGRPRPVAVLGAALLTGIMALAGPAWQREPTPFSEDQAALVIALKVTPEMLASDIQPTRLQRGMFKIRDLLAARPGTRNALIAYAGSAHLVMPLTTDSGVIETFAAELNPDLMPVPGDAAARAVTLANRQLQGAGVPGSILLIADAVDSSQLEELQSAHDGGGADVHILAMAAGAEVIPPADSPLAPALDESAMQSAARAGGGSLTLVSADDADIRRLVGRIESSLASAPLQEGSRWRDAGYYLLPVLAILLLLLYRPGGSAPIFSAAAGRS